MALLAAAVRPNFNSRRDKRVPVQALTRASASLSTTFWGSALCPGGLGLGDFHVGTLDAETIVARILGDALFVDLEVVFLRRLEVASNHHAGC